MLQPIVMIDKDTERHSRNRKRQSLFSRSKEGLIGWTVLMVDSMIGLILSTLQGLGAFRPLLLRRVISLPVIFFKVILIILSSTFMLGILQYSCTYRLQCILCTG